MRDYTAGSVGLSIFIGKAHETLGIVRIIEPPIRDRGYGDASLEVLSCLTKAHKAHITAIAVTKNAYPLKVGPRLMSQHAQS